MSFNGYKNYPTFYVDLHLHNNREYHDEVMVRLNRNMQPFERAEMLKALVLEELRPSFADDLLAWALSQVDWVGVAASWAEEAETA